MIFKVLFNTNLSIIPPYLSFLISSLCWFSWIGNQAGRTVKEIGLISKVGVSSLLGSGPGLLQNILLCSLDTCVAVISKTEITVLLHHTEVHKVTCIPTHQGWNVFCGLFLWSHRPFTYLRHSGFGVTQEHFFSFYFFSKILNMVPRKQFFLFIAYQYGLQRTSVVFLPMD